MRRLWWNLTHKQIYTQNPRKDFGAYFTIYGRFTVIERRWYKITRRILWGQT